MQKVSKELFSEALETVIKLFASQKETNKALMNDLERVRDKVIELEAHLELIEERRIKELESRNNA